MTCRQNKIVEKTFDKRKNNNKLNSFNISYVYNFLTYPNPIEVQSRGMEKKEYTVLLVD